MTTPHQPRWRALCLLVVLTTGLKLAVVLAPRPDLYHSDPAARPAIHVGEEIHRGSTAVELLDGPILPVLDYQYAHFFGGSLVVSIVAMPFVALFGPSILSVKLAPLVFNALAVALLFLILDRWASRRAAWIGGLSYAVASPGYSLLATTAFGSHVESNALVLACVYLALRMYDDDPPRPARALAFGALAGFAVYFGYIVLIALAAIALHRFLEDRGFVLRRSFGLVLVGFAVGLSPWLVYNLRHDFAGTKIYGRGVDTLLGEADSPSRVGRFAELISDHYAHSFFFRDQAGLPRAALDWTFALGLAAAAALAVLAFGRQRGVDGRPREARLGSLCTLYLVFYALAYVTTDFKLGNPRSYAVSYRYLYTTYPFLFMAAGLGLDALAQCCARGRVAARFWAALLVGLGLFGNLGLVQPNQLGAPLEVPGYSRVTFGRFIVLRYLDELDQVHAAIESARERRTQRDLDDLIYGISMQLRQTLRPGAQLRRSLRERLPELEALRAELHERLEPRYRPYFEPVEADERTYGEHDKERFWRDYGPRPE